jgi:hypothetical protein
MTDVKIYVNLSATDSSYVAAPGNWVEFDPLNDKIIPSYGSAEVADGLAIPGETALNLAATTVSSTALVHVAKYFLADASDGLLHLIPNMGNVNKRYAIAFSFDGATTSEPVLEVWDDTSLNTYYSKVLGGDGVSVPSAADSWYYGVCTTTSLPVTIDALWLTTGGIHLAGSGISNVVYLNSNNGALSAAGILYANFKIVVPINPNRGGSNTPVLNVKFAGN